MNRNIKILLAAFALLGVAGSCTKMRDVGVLNTGNFTDTAGPLKGATDINLGVAIDYTPMMRDANYSAVAKRDFGGVTFGYQMKHGAIVQNDGSFNYTKTDSLVNICTTLGLKIYGHTLGWHANQNATYLKSYAGITANASAAQIAAKLDTALGNFITSTVTRYKGQVRAWDVVNELFADNGSIRNNSNTATSASDVLVWSNYLGRNYAFKAFNYARAADSTALLFINDYALESNSAKIDSLIAMVSELKGRGAKVDGIGTQMHIAWNTTYAGIDAMMKKLAATGLLIRISELDVKVNPMPKSGFIFTPAMASYQADMYQYVIKSYMANIPKAQQYGITIWGITDNTSWLYNNGQDFPLLYNADYSKKPAYAGVLKALKGK